MWLAAISIRSCINGPGLQMSGRYFTTMETSTTTVQIDLYSKEYSTSAEFQCSALQRREYGFVIGMV